jgi:hypothetical protein
MLASDDFTNEPTPELDEDIKDVDYLLGSEEDLSSDNEDRVGAVNANQSTPKHSDPAYSSLVYRRGYNDKRLSLG